MFYRSDQSILYPAIYRRRVVWERVAYGDPLHPFTGGNFCTSLYHYYYIVLDLSRPGNTRVTTSRLGHGIMGILSDICQGIMRQSRRSSVQRTKTVSDYRLHLGSNAFLSDPIILSNMSNMYIYSRLLNMNNQQIIFFLLHKISNT